jgi:bifunctional DNA-binding transcriptional regulator/antitoxin component of YhaV-PrlF toxin-antitoxin module
MSLKLTPNFEVEIPKELRDQLGLQVGDEVAWVFEGKSAKLVRVPTIDEMKGTLRGYDVGSYRDEGDRV